jgi:hypothetical protein
MLDPALLERSSHALAQGMFPVFIAIAVLGTIAALAGLTFPNLQTTPSRPPLDPAD